MGPVGKLLSNKNQWTKTTKALSAKEHGCPATSDKAVAWSVEGAIDKCYPPREREQVMTLFMTVANQHYPKYDYERLHMALSHEALMFILKECEI